MWFWIWSWTLYRLNKLMVAWISRRRFCSWIARSINSTPSCKVAQLQRCESEAWLAIAHKAVRQTTPGETFKPEMPQKWWRLYVRHQNKWFHVCVQSWFPLPWTHWVESKYFAPRIWSNVWNQILNCGSYMEFTLQRLQEHPPSFRKQSFGIA